MTAWLLPLLPETQKAPATWAFLPRPESRLGEMRDVSMQRTAGALLLFGPAACRGLPILVQETKRTRVSFSPRLCLPIFFWKEIVCRIREKFQTEPLQIVAWKEIDRVLRGRGAVDRWSTQEAHDDLAAPGRAIPMISTKNS